MNQKELSKLKRKKKKQLKQKTNYAWIVQITLLAFVISFSFSLLSESALPNFPIWAGILIVLLFIGIGILFDMIGVAVTSADEKPIHSIAAQKVKGSTMAIMLKKNADRVSSFCNDVIGDICGILSGSAGVTIAISLANSFSFPVFWMTLAITAIIAAFTIGGKALGKGIALSKNQQILIRFARVLSLFYHPHQK